MSNYYHGKSKNLGVKSTNTNSPTKASIYKKQNNDKCKRLIYNFEMLYSMMKRGWAEGSIQIEKDRLYDLKMGMLNREERFE